ncbi:MAG: peptide chain release factor N(5)-glutamine methyltransferase [Bacteroidales bacterium]|nr:peptide chain release factor N(5)-glutamine methyltransferase [Bacteroidales bacterium]
MKNSELFYTLRANLTKVYDGDENAAKAVAVKIFLYLYNISLTEVLTYPDRKIEGFSSEKLNTVLERIKKSEPLEYIFNRAQFLDLELFTESSVLIPRPETEEFALMVSEEMRNKSSAFEVGFGSGCISIYLALRHHYKKFYGCDISDSALEVCQKNIEKYGVKNLEVFLADIFEFKTSQKFDVILSNPPYVTESEKLLMKKNVLDYEPFTALFVPDDDALKFYRKISEFAAEHLNSGGKLFFEINENFGKETAQLVESYGFKNVEVVKDFYGKDRFVKSTF